MPADSLCEKSVWKPKADYVVSVNEQEGFLQLTFALSADEIPECDVTNVMATLDATDGDKALVTITPAGSATELKVVDRPPPTEPRTALCLVVKRQPPTPFEHASLAGFAKQDVLLVTAPAGRKFPMAVGDIVKRSTKSGGVTVTLPLEEAPAEEEPLASQESSTSSGWGGGE